MGVTGIRWSSGLALWLVLGALGCSTSNDGVIQPDGGKDDLGGGADVVVPPPDIPLAPTDVVMQSDVPAVALDGVMHPDVPDVPPVDVPDVPPVDIPDVPCPAPQSLCVGACVNLNNDSMNCGTCGTRCSPGLVCAQGTCVCPIDSGMTLCGGTCVNTANSPTNCGACGQTCPMGSVCAASSCVAPRVDAIHPPIVDGNSGTIYLEGVFGSTATVTFPGVTSPVNATVLGPGRIRVDVPAGATAGALTVRSAGVTATSSQRFRRASFGLGLQPFRARYEQADYARQTPSLSVARVNAASVNTGAWLYVMGGANVSGAGLNSIERAMINADGTLGAFQTTAVGLGAPREGAAAIRVGDVVYLLGGSVRGASVASIESAAVSTAGMLGEFVNATQTLQTARSGHVAEIIGGYVYVFGGDTDVVERAPILAERGIGAFVRVAGVTTRARRQRPAIQVVGGYVYLMGGVSAGLAVRSVERAEINPDGTLGNFAMADDLTVEREGAASIMLGNRVFIAGGSDGTTARNSIEYAEISPSGGLGPFAPLSTSRLSAPRRGASATLVGNYWYMVGGATSEPLASIDRAEVNVSGGFIAPATGVPGMAEPRANLIPVAIGPYVYAVGGGGPAGIDRHIERATVSPSGTLGNFAVYTPSGGELTAEGPAVAVVSNTLYVIAGRTGDGQRYLGTMRSFPIQEDGSLGAGTTAHSAGLNVAWGRALVLDDRLCIFGGGSSSSGRSDVIYCAPVRSGGGLDAFAAMTSARLPQGLSHLQATLLGGSVLLTGGSDENTSVRTIIRCEAPPGAPAGITGCAPATGQLTRGRVGLSGFIVGNQVSIAGGAASGVYWNDVERAPLLDSGSPGTFAPVGGLLLPGPRALHGALVIDNSVWLLGGGSPADPDSVSGSNVRIDLR